MKQQLTQEQKLTWKMTQKLSQAIEILQYNGYDLYQFLQDQVKENPLIELEPIEQFYEQNQSRSRGLEHELIASTQTMYDLLKKQLSDFSIPEALRKVILYGIDSLNENGYLTISYQEWREKTSVDSDLIDEAIRVLHSLEPAGIGARSLQECIILQLQRKKVPQAICSLVDNHLDWIADEELSLISSEYAIKDEQASEWIDMVRSCHPRPGVLLQEVNSDYIIPDAEIYIEEGIWTLKLSPWNKPEIKMNMEYAFTDRNQELEEYIKEKSEHANWLIKSVAYRANSLERIILAIVKKQLAFFEYGAERLEALTLQLIAEQVNLHVSTVSRAIKGKYIQTPHGVFSLKFFFQQAIKTDNGRNVSSFKVKQLILDYIKTEDVKKPISDQQISNKLKEQYGILLSRRTIVKYREELGVLSSVKRKKQKRE